LIGLVGVAVASLGVAVALWLGWGDSSEVGSFGADSFSRSALGHRALVALLRAEGIAVVVSQHESDRRAGAGAVLVVAEPQLDGPTSARARRLGLMLGSVRTALVVLPKWSGREDPLRPGWIDQAAPVAEAAVATTLQVTGITATVTRQDGEGSQSCAGADSKVTLMRPQLLSAPSTVLRPLIHCEKGILLGEVMASAPRRIVVLSDPGVLSNHGLSRGDNARLALEIVNRVRNAQQALVIDETVHGNERIPSVWRELLRFPLWPAVLQAALALSFWLWSGMGRFGAPLPAPSGLAAGKSVLIENTASLLGSAGHSAYTLRRYFDVAVLDVARSLHAPAGAKPEYLHGWLTAAGRRRRVTVELDSLAEQVGRIRRSASVNAESVVAVARRVHRWKQEMVHGAPRSPGR